MQWIDLPPSFHLPPKGVHLAPLSAHSPPSASPDSTPTEPSSSSLGVPVGLLPQSILQEQFHYPLSASPPIHRVPNKFFDSLSSADLARGRPSARNASSSSLPGLLAKSLESDEEHGGKGKGKVVRTVELQFAEQCIANYAHFGYVVRSIATPLELCPR